VSEKLITKGMKPFVVQLLGDEPESKKYTIKKEDGEVQTDKSGLIKEIAKLFKAASKVNFEDNSEDRRPDSNQGASHDEIEKYAAENKINYSAAYKKLNAGKLKPASTEDVED